jgi:myo-inositol-1(or 4)-monophosphatase
VSGETFRATRGGGAELDGEPIRVNDGDTLETALIGTGFGYEPHVRAGQADLLREILPRVRDIRRAGAAALDLCFVACGRLDGYYERGINRWDWAAGALIVREAGGAVVELEGGRAGLAAAGPRLVGPLAELARE